ncbi:MAG: hypothetical protein SGJ24_07950 [Chloroflexota bacterium]|nr:hypothetical protein [Chloroflexota bacterium]
MRLRLLALPLCALILAACQGFPPTVVYVVVTATPNPNDIALDATRDTAVTLVAQAGLVAAPVNTVMVPIATATLGATIVLTPAATAVVSAATALPPTFPTPVIAQITVAEQLFEGGRMFWIQPTGQIWLLMTTQEGTGEWSIYADDFVDGEPDLDSTLVPPDGRYQPERGFGKLWRESEAINQSLGWGVTPEFGYVSRYEYHAGGSVDAATGIYTPGPGYHILFSLGGEQFRFDETDSTWRLGDGV